MEDNIEIKDHLGNSYNSIGAMCKEYNTTTEIFIENTKLGLNIREALTFGKQDTSVAFEKELSDKQEVVKEFQIDTEVNTDISIEASNRQKEILKGLEIGVDVSMYNNEKFSVEMLELLVYSLKYEVDYSNYIEILHEFSPEQLEIVFKGVQIGINLMILDPKLYTSNGLNNIYEEISAEIDKFELGRRSDWMHYKEYEAIIKEKYPICTQKIEVFKPRYRKFSFDVKLLGKFNRDEYLSLLKDAKDKECYNNGMFMRLCRYQTYEICKESCERNAMNLVYIKDEQMFNDILKLIADEKCSDINSRRQFISKIKKLRQKENLSYSNTYENNTKNTDGIVDNLLNTIKTYRDKASDKESDKGQTEKEEKVYSIFGKKFRIIDSSKKQ